MLPGSSIAALSSAAAGPPDSAAPNSSAALAPRQRLPKNCALICVSSAVPPAVGALPELKRDRRNQEAIATPRSGGATRGSPRPPWSSNSVGSKARGREPGKFPVSARVVEVRAGERIRLPLRPSSQDGKTRRFRRWRPTVCADARTARPCDQNDVERPERAYPGGAEGDGLRGRFSPAAKDSGVLGLAGLLTKCATFPCRIAKETVSPLFRTPVQLSPSQIVDAIRAAGDRAETTTATDSHVEGRFIGGFRKRFVVNATKH